MRIDVYSDNSPQMEITNDECERNNIVVLQATFPEIKCDLMTDSLKQTTNLQQKGFIKVDYALKDVVTNVNKCSSLAREPRSVRCVRPGTSGMISICKDRLIVAAGLCKDGILFV